MCSSCMNQYQTNYDQYQRENHFVYTDKRWSVLKAKCKGRANGIDLYHYYKTGRIVEGSLAHHIVEVSEDISKAYDIDNLFWLTPKSHQEIHALYKRNKQVKEDTQRLLLKINKNLMGGRLECFRRGAKDQRPTFLPGNCQKLKILTCTN